MQYKSNAKLALLNIQCLHYLHVLLTLKYIYNIDT